MFTTQQIHQVFAAHGLRCTRQREALYRALASTTAHPTADDLFRSMHGKENDMSLATVYNTLEAFCKAGLALRLPGHEGSARYDATTENHMHLRDNVTGRMADVPDDLSQQLLKHLPPEVLKQLEQRLGFKIDQVQIELVGQFGDVSRPDDSK